MVPTVIFFSASFGYFTPHLTTVTIKLADYYIFFIRSRMFDGDTNPDVMFLFSLCDIAATMVESLRAGLRVRAR